MKGVSIVGAFVFMFLLNSPASHIGSSCTTLKFELIMATTGDGDSSWEEVMGKDLITKVLRKGSGGQAEMGTVVTCNLRGFFVENGNVLAESFEEWANQSFKIGESDAVPGVEMALRFSRVGDILRVRCNSRFGYGPTGRPEVVVRNGTEAKEEGTETFPKSIVAIPADKDLEYELEILSHLPDGEVDPVLLNAHPFDESRTFESDDADATEESSRAKAFRNYMERLQALTELQQRKEAGNRWFSYGDFARSARAYSKATQIADRYFNGNANNSTPAQALQGLNPSEEGAGGAAAGGSSSLGEANAALEAAEKAKEAQRRSFEAGDEEVVAVYVSCLNNLAACQLRLGDNAKVKDICIRVLEIEPANHKALLRAAKAALATHDYEECEVCLQRLVEVAPPGSSAAVAAATERRRLKQAQLEYKQQQKKMSDNMARQLFHNNNNNKNNNNNNPTSVNGSSSSSKNSSSKSNNSKSSDHSNSHDNNNADSSSADKVAVPTAKEGKDKVKDDDTQQAAAAGASTAAATTTGATATTATTTTTTGSADWGLLLLLLTSLAVLLVSICLVVWTNKK